MLLKVSTAAETTRLCRWRKNTRPPSMSPRLTSLTRSAAPATFTFRTPCLPRTSAKSGAWPSG
eukprot:7732724-Pyramimonas_sp.AAC.1